MLIGWFKSSVNFVKQLKFINKLMLMYVIGGLIPILFVTIYLSGSTRQIILDSAMAEVIQNNNRVSDRLNEIFNVAAAIQDEMFTDVHLDRIINTAYVSKSDAVKDIAKFDRIDNLLRLYLEIESIRLYIENDTLPDEGQIVSIKNKDKKEKWYKNVLDAGDKDLYEYKYDKYDSTYYLCLLKGIYNKNGEFVGVLSVNVSNRYMAGIFNNETYDIILTMGNRIVLSTEQYLEGKITKDIPIGQVFEEYETGFHDFDSGNRQYRVRISEVVTKYEDTTFKLYTFLSLNDLVQKADESEENSRKIIAGSIIISLILIYLMSKALTSRINQFSQDMHKVATGDFGFKTSIEGKDELGQLSVDLNSMIESIQRLIYEVYEVKIQKEQLRNKQREVEFKMLSSQINPPHFLYNSLEGIRMNALMNGQRETADIVMKLARLMRRYLSYSNEEIHLQKELDLIEDYLQIQQYRFEEDVSFEICVECNIASYYVLPLLLQPIVENAFIHGLEKKIGHGHISIKIFEQNECINISVSDNGGVGIKPAKLDSISELLRENKANIGSSIGLANVNQRIRIYYGDDYDMTLHSCYGQGTTVTLKLPMKRSEAIV